MAAQTSIVRITIVGLVSLAIAMGIGRFAFTPMLPLMQQEGIVTIADSGLLASVHFFGYLLGAIFATKLSRAPKLTLQFSLIAIGICTLGMGLVEDLTLWLVFRWLAGVCSAFTLVLISSYYVKHLATLGHSGRQGWVFSGVGAGIAIAGLGALVIMVNQTGSAGGWQIFGAASLLIAVALSMLMGPEIPTRFDPISEREGPRSPVRWSHVIAYGAMGIGYVIPATYLPIMAREIVQSPLVFGWSWPVFGLAALMSTPLVGVFQRRFSNRQIWAGCQIIMAVGLIFPVIYPQIGAIIVSGFCVGGTFMVITMMGMVEAHRLAPPQDVMRHIAIMTTAFALGQMIGPVFASWLYGVTQDFSASMLITSAALILTAIPLALNRRPGIGSTHRV